MKDGDQMFPITSEQKINEKALNFSKGALRAHIPGQ